MRKRAVLVVDDEESLRNYARDCLQADGIGVMLARDGAEAVEMFRSYSSRIGLVLLDMDMPRMNGEQALRELLTLDPGLCVLICSGSDPVTIEARLDGLDVQGFVPKPYRPAQLVARVRELLEV